MAVALVTGGAGFIGSHLVEGLLASGRIVRVLDDLSTGLLTNFDGFPGSAEFRQGSLTQWADVRAAMEGVQEVYHLGAMASVAKSLEQPLECHAVCSTGTLHVLEAARQAGVKRVVYAASSSAYGTASDPAGQPEATPLQTLSPYAAAKLNGEHYLEAYATSYGMETVRLRFFNIFGPRQRADSPYSGVIAIFVAALMDGRTPKVHGDGGQCRDFTYVGNAVQALMKAATAPAEKVAGRVYNVGTGRTTTLLQLLETLDRILGTKTVPIHSEGRVGDVRFSLAQIDAIQRDLEYVPAIDLEEGLRRTVAWYRSIRAL
ncbi:MAG: NAD-dependent epimerase/dehydratase family protein [Gemmataceae bacterium]